MVTRYCHKQVISILTALVTALFFLPPSFSDARQTETADKTIQYLLEYVARSDLTFLRNSGRYSALEASEHMQKKFEHFRDKIETPEEFIELCATRSLLSGKPYQVINKHGETVNTSEWLTAELNEYRNSATTGDR
jgi:Family of unknown function (DUF5329)